MSFEDFTGYVLAGGKSSRMRTDKAFLEIGGETFLARAAGILSKVFDNRVKIVLNRTQTHFIERLPAGIPYIFDVYENRGALGGIHAALNDCETKFAVILAVDLPFVSHKILEKLCEIASSSNKFAVVVPLQADGTFQPLCAVYRAGYCLPSLEQLMYENDSASVRDFLDSIAPRFVEENKLTERTNDVFFNVNRPSDFKKIA